MNALDRLIQPALMLGLVAATSTVALAAPSSGSAWPELAKRVDPLVDALMSKQKVPGMTIAVSKDGRLVFSKGYGHARATGKLIGMKPDHRSRIGSVTKAVVTGPAGYQLMKAKGVNPATQTLYGTAGLFGSRFDGDLAAGVSRFTPIAAMAIAPDDRVYTWHTDGNVSVGTSSDLDHFKPARAYTLPPGKTPRDIRAMAISKGSKVYTWYEDGSRSIGTSTDLDRYSGLTKAGSVSLAPGKSMVDVVGAAIRKSDDHLYVWYMDGTFSSGTSTDFDAYADRKPYTFAPGSGGTSYNVRGMGIAKNGRVYAWFANGFASSGLSTKLHHYRKPYAYSLAEPPPTRTGGATSDRREWFRSITIQHLLDHRSGFMQTETGAWELGRAAHMLRTTQDALTYEQVHRVFLRTRKLLFRPGTSYSYSNHNFGLWTLLIERLSGKPFLRYVRDSYLKPMALHNRIVPETGQAGSYDARNYELRKGKFVDLGFKDYGLGIAAGGYRAAAQDVVRAMAELDQRYTEQDLGRMGWAKEKRGKLFHNGSIGGGAAFAVMYPQGYRSLSNRDISRVHVAVLANRRVDTKLLDNLASQIALEVPASRVSSQYDIWKMKPAK